MNRIAIERLGVPASVVDEALTRRTMRDGMSSRSDRVAAVAPSDAPVAAHLDRRGQVQRRRQARLPTTLLWLNFWSPNINIFAPRWDAAELREDLPHLQDGRRLVRGCRTTRATEAIAPDASRPQRAGDRRGLETRKRKRFRETNGASARCRRGEGRPSRCAYTADGEPTGASRRMRPTSARRMGSAGSRLDCDAARHIQNHASPRPKKRGVAVAVRRARPACGTNTVRRPGGPEGAHKDAPIDRAVLEAPFRRAVKGAAVRPPDLAALFPHPLEVNDSARPRRVGAKGGA